jgi:hypothetical protein
MLLTIQILTIAVMLASTYIVFKAFGPQRQNLLYTQEEKKQWDSLIGKEIGSWLTISNIVGTLTSLATVYIFFIGNAKLFGYFTFICAITIFFGSYITNYITKKICEIPYIQNIIDSHDQSGGVIASIFWRPYQNERRTSFLVKWISLINIFGLIWLDFAIFTDISSSILSIESLLAKLLILFCCCFIIFHFTLKYGLRGFVFADLFQSPMILISSALLIIGSIILFFSENMHAIKITQLMKPHLQTSECLLFALHALLVNSMFVLVTEPHWLRVWIFKQKETNLQPKATAITSSIWILLILIGLIAGEISVPHTGEAAIINLLNNLSSISPIFLVGFWIGSTAALFASADSQIYSFLIVREFNIKTGKLNQRLMSSIKPSMLSLVISSLFCLTYYLVRNFELPLEKIIFLVIPLSFNILPCLILAARGRKFHYSYILLSVFLYMICSGIGLHQPDEQYSWTLLAALSPFVATAIAFIFTKKNSPETEL